MLSTTLYFCLLGTGIGNVAVCYTDIIQPLSFLCVRALFNHCYRGNLPSSFLCGDIATHQLAIAEKPVLTQQFPPEIVMD